MSYAGVDWAADKHDVLVADEAGNELLSATFVHDENGLRSLCRQLLRLKVQLVAIERPDGLLVERLLDAGLRVLALHPNQVAATRARFRVSGGKSDRFDAFVPCELARTDSHRFRVLEPDTDETKALTALTRTREDLVKTKVAVGNQLRSELERFWPGPIGLFNDLDSQISLAFLERYPSPADARGWASSAWRRSLPASTTRVARSPRSCWPSSGARRGGESATQSSRRAGSSCSASSRRSTRSSPRSRRSSGRSRPRCAPIPTAPSSCRCSRTPTASSRQPRCWRRWATAARANPARDALAGDAGQAAVAIESGKRKAACFRWGCNKRLRSSFSRLADTTRHWHPWAQDRYAAGHDHPRALRTLGRAWCRIVWQCWQDRTPYDPARHRGLQQHLLVTVPTPSGPCPTSLPPSGCSAPPPPTRRPAGPSAKRLTASRHPLSRLGIDVMKGRAGSGGPGLVRPGCRRSALRPEPQSSRPRGVRPARPDNSRGGPTVSNPTRWVGIDLHRRRSQIAIIDDHGELTASRRIVNDRETFRELLGDPHGTHVALEATYGWEWLAELLEEGGYDVHPAHPLRTQDVQLSFADRALEPELSVSRV
jgi:transposase